MSLEPYQVFCRESNAMTPASCQNTDCKHNIRSIPADVWEHTFFPIQIKPMRTNCDQYRPPSTNSL